MTMKIWLLKPVGSLEELSAAAEAKAISWCGWVDCRGYVIAADYPEDARRKAAADERNDIWLDETLITCEEIRYYGANSGGNSGQNPQVISMTRADSAMKRDSVSLALWGQGRLPVTLSPSLSRWWWER